MTHTKIEGVTTWSESVMVLHFDEALANGFSLRLSRYPALGATWLWLHVISDGHLYTYTNQFLPSTADQMKADTDVASYEVPGLAVRMTRAGTSAGMQRLSYAATLMCHRDKSGIDGPGNVPVQLEGIFYPGPLRAGSPAGRFERSGRVEASLTVAHRTQSLAGIAKAHEQTQTNPRFAGAFTYAMLWGADASMTGLFAKARSYGDFETTDADRPLSQFLVQPWATERKFVAVTADGTRIPGTARTAHSFDVPVFDKLWHGHIVSAEAGGHRMVGMINDWKPEQQDYTANL